MKYYYYINVFKRKSLLQFRSSNEELHFSKVILPWMCYVSSDITSIYKPSVLFCFTFFDKFHENMKSQVTKKKEKRFFLRLIFKIFSKFTFQSFG